MTDSDKSKLKPGTLQSAGAKINMQQYNRVQFSPILFAPTGAPTNLQPTRSWASQRSSFQVFPASFISSSTVLLQVPRGLPLLPSPGAQRSASPPFSRCPVVCLSSHSRCPVVCLLFPRWCPFQSDMWKTTSAHAENRAKPSPSFFHPIQMMLSMLVHSKMFLLVTCCPQPWVNIFYYSKNAPEAPPLKSTTSLLYIFLLVRQASEECWVCKCNIYFQLVLDMNWMFRC